MSSRDFAASARLAALQMVGDADDPKVIGQFVEEGACARASGELGRVVGGLVTRGAAPIVAARRVNVERDRNKERAPPQLILEECV